MKQLRCWMILAFMGLFLSIGLRPVLAEADGSKENPIPVPEGYSPAPVSEGLKPGDTAKFVTTDGKKEIIAEREALDNDRLGLHYRTADGKLWRLAVYQKGLDEDRELFYHFEPAEN